MLRLSSTTLPQATAAALPAYARARLATGIVHLGVGAFHRAHQAVYTDDVLNRGDTRWGIVGASLRSTETRDALAPQDGLYTLATRDAAGERLRVVGVLRQVLVAPEDSAALVKVMAHPSVAIVSLTITEKGYCHHPSSGELDETHPDIRHDLAAPQSPVSAPGFIVAALAARRRQGLPPFAVLSCDNLPANGRVAAGVVQRLAALHDPELGRYVAGEVAFPSTMVDRIVPATTAEDRTRVAGVLGLEDAWPVVSEPFAQWVVEDRFPQGRPEWQATFVDDVAPFETMKLRLLNGAHSTLAYLGFLAGCETVSEAMAVAPLAALVARLMREEAAPSLAMPRGVDVGAYIAALLERFRNPALRHRTWQIAMDGSQKLPQRLLNTARWRLARDLPLPCIALGVAAWMRYVTGVDEKGHPIDVRDPLRDELEARCRAAGRDAHRLAASLLAIEKIFGRDLPQDQRFVSAVTAALDDLLRHGAATTVSRMQGRN